MPRAKKTPVPKTTWLEADIALGPVTLRQKAVLAKNLAIMLSAGLTITDALSELVKVSHGRPRAVMSEVYRAVEAGESLATALGRYSGVFPNFFVGAVYAGEMSGTLSENLTTAAAALEREQSTMEKVRSAMIYPIVVVTAAAILGVVVSLFVLPRIVPLFKTLKIKLPWTTIVLISVADFLKNYGTIFAIGLAVLVAVAWFLLTRKFAEPVSHALILNLPLARKVSANLNLSRFCSLTASALASGLNIVDALGVVENTLSNYYYRRSVQRIKKNVEKGARLAVCLERQASLFSDMSLKMIAVGEQSGRLEEVLVDLSQYYESEMDREVKNLAAAIEPILILIIGLSVGFLAISIITPIYSLTGSIAR